MKAKVYIAPTQYAYRAAEDGQSIQFLDTTMNLGWKHSDYMTGKVLKAARPAQEVLDEEAARRGWQLWEEPEGQAAGAQDNAVQLAAILADRYKRSGGEMTAEGFKKFLGTGGYGDPDLGDIEYDYKGVSIRPEPQRWTREMKFTWAKFIKFCRDNGLIEEKPLKVASKPVSEQAEENPIHAAEDAPTCAPTVSDAQPSPLPSVGVDAKTEVGADDLPEVCRGCQCVTCGNKDCAFPCWTKSNEVSSCERIGPAGVDCKDYQPIEEESVKCNTKFAQKPAAAATTAAPVVATSEETSTASESAVDAAGSKPELSFVGALKNLSAPASPADAGAATQSLSAAAPASSEVLPLDSSAFDYTGLDQPTVDTLHLAERMIRDARRDYITKLAQAVYIVHDALCGGGCDNLSQAHNNQHSEKTFGAWCAYVGISRKTGERLLQVAALLNGSTPEEQAVLEAASPSLLYAAAKPSAPAELVQAVKDGDITTHKQYQELLAQLKAKDQELAAERADREAERTSTSALLADEQHRRQEAEQARIAAEKSAQGARESYRVAKKNEMFQMQRAKDAENQRSLMEERERFYLAKIAELEARPVEVVGADPDEIERRAQVLADQKTAQIQAELAKIRTEQKASDNQSVQRAAHDAVILATRSMDAAWQAMAPMLSRLAPEEKVPVIYKVVNQLMCMKEEALQMIEKEKKPDADHQN